MKEQLVTVPNKSLREVTQKVTSFDKELLKQIKTMRRFLKTHDGAGLAANQMGLQNKVLVIELIDEKPENSIPFQIFINPEIIELSEECDSLEEGCLSVPKIELPVERALKVKFKAQRADGKKIRQTAKGILARILQHEIDHLNGIVFTDKIRTKFYQDNPKLKNLKIVFIGSGDFATTILEGLILLGSNLLIITEKGKPAGRNREIQSTPVLELSRLFEKEIIETENIGSDFINQKITKFQGDIIISVDFGQKIPEHILQSAKITALNIHPSLLPLYRGASPIPYSILNDDKVTGVSIIKMTQEFDAGPIIGQVKTEILPDDDSKTLEERLSTLALKLLFEALPLIYEDKLQIEDQDPQKVTLAPKLKKADGEIDWQKPIEEIERKIRAFNPWPGTFTFINKERLIIRQAHLEEGVLVLDLVQKEGGKTITWEAFLRGFRDQKPAWFTKIKSV